MVLHSAQIPRRVNPFARRGPFLVPERMPVASGFVPEAISVVLAASRAPIEFSPPLDALEAGEDEEAANLDSGFAGARVLVFADMEDIPIGEASEDEEREDALVLSFCSEAFDAPEPTVLAHPRPATPAPVVDAPAFESPELDWPTEVVVPAPAVAPPTLTTQPRPPRRGPRPPRHENTVSGWMIAGSAALLLAGGWVWLRHVLGAAANG